MNFMYVKVNAVVILAIQSRSAVLSLLFGLEKTESNESKA
jgi:hypothetical protein